MDVKFGTYNSTGITWSSGNNMIKEKIFFTLLVLGSVLLIATMIYGIEVMGGLMGF